MAVKSIDEFISSLDDQNKMYVVDFMKFMEVNFPSLKPKISFSMPMWLFHKKMNEVYIGISTAKKHVTVHFSDEEIIHELGRVLTKCKTGKRCINISHGDEEAYEYVKEQVKFFVEKRLEHD